MKCILSTLLAVTVLAGCSVAPVAHETDQAKVTAVERAAARGGVRIIWLNAPQKVVRGG